MKTRIREGLTRPVSSCLFHLLPRGLWETGSPCLTLVFSYWDDIFFAFNKHDYKDQK